MPAFYKRYVDDTLSKIPDVSSASEFLLTQNGIHPSLSFTMELEDNSKLPFLGMVIIRNGPRLETKVYVIFILPRLNMRSDELRKLVWNLNETSRINRVKLGLVLVITHRYQF